MATPNIFTDTTPLVDAAEPSLARSVITDAWGLHFAQGGVVMAAALRAMDAVLDRDDLAVASASAGFCRPVACGPVETTVHVLRNGRRGAQVQGSLRDRTAPEGAVSVAVSAVFTDPQLPGPQLAPVPRPAELRTPPGPDEAATIDNDFPLGFLDNTAWHVAAGPGPARIDAAPLDAAPFDAAPFDAAPFDAALIPDEPIPRLALWFRFTDPPAAADGDWDPSLLAIPGDSLGSALVVALGGGDTPVGSVSLQIDVQVLAPIRGNWVGIDSMCTHLGNGLASGVLHLWSEDGVHVATVTQTAMLRTFGE
jgi:acyl-CoA thioesterase